MVDCRESKQTEQQKCDPAATHCAAGRVVGNRNAFAGHPFVNGFYMLDVPQFGDDGFRFLGSSQQHVANEIKAPGDWQACRIPNPRKRTIGIVDYPCRKEEHRTEYKQQRQLQNGDASFQHRFTRIVGIVVNRDPGTDGICLQQSSKSEVAV